MKKGFTLIEMMIVVAIIAIIAAIAIPSLLAARRASLETNACGSMRAYCSAQVMFKRNDWDGDGVLSYAAPAAAGPSYWLLNTQVDGNGNPLQLLDAAFAAAQTPNNVAGPPATGPKHGYWFSDIATLGEVAPIDMTDPTNWANDYVLTGIPAIYGRTGYRTFIVCTNGTTFGLDRGSALTPVPVPVYPDNPSDPVNGPWIVSE